jgi:hypothetical protein
MTIRSSMTETKTIDREVRVGRFSPMIALLALPGALFAASAPATIDFNRQVRPILSENCFKCHGHRNTNRKFAITLFGSESIADGPHPPAFQSLLHELLLFFKTGVAPILPEETLEILAFMEATDESKRRGGVPVSLAGIIQAGSQ